MSTLLFVYGTLKRGHSNHHHLADQTFIGLARTPAGYRLYDLGGFPGIAPVPGDQTGVVGEVWAVDPDALARLDVFEGVHEGLYRRAAIVLAPPFAGRAIEAYFPAIGVGGRPEVGSEWLG